MNNAPFRTHLLQQWARTCGKSSNGRPPAAISTWLQPSNSEAATEEQIRGGLVAHGHHTSTSSTKLESQRKYLDTRYAALADNSIASSLLSNTTQSAAETTRHRDSKSNEGNGALPHAYEDYLREALQRALDFAMLHQPQIVSTGSFSAQSFFRGSQTSRKLADISYHMTFLRSGSKHHAESERKKWLGIPAYLVAIVRNNQKQENGSLLIISSSDASVAVRKERTLEGSMEYHALPYHPPDTERQLLDNVILSLRAETIDCKWVTGSLIRTPAFRALLSHLLPCDRVVGLLMMSKPKVFNAIQVTLKGLETPCKSTGAASDRDTVELP